ncbi:MAG: DUF47 family protein [Firmicutes bacterium]|nr:DUF47 family protein [Bacillota bacterium]
MSAEAKPMPNGDTFHEHRKLYHRHVSRWQAWLARLHGVLPPQVDFFALMQEHAQKVEQTLIQLRAWFRARTPEAAQAVSQAEHEADEVVDAISDYLGEVFFTPLDREDIHDLSVELDEVADYAKATVKEMQLLEVEADGHLHEMVELLIAGTYTVRQAIGYLKSAPREARNCAIRARKTENAVETTYRRALKDLFESQDVISILKKRELYRHLSNAADRLDRVGDLIARISTKLI